MRSQGILGHQDVTHHYGNTWKFPATSLIFYHLVWRTAAQSWKWCLQLFNTQSWFLFLFPGPLISYKSVHSDWCILYQESSSFWLTVCSHKAAVTINWIKLVEKMTQVQKARKRINITLLGQIRVHTLYCMFIVRWIAQHFTAITVYFAANLCMLINLI